MKTSLISFFLFGAILSAAPISVSLVSGGAGGSQAGPYTLDVNGTNTLAMCMDDLKTSYTGAQYGWSANVTNVSGSDFSKTYLGNYGMSVEGYNLSSKQIYTAEAYLFSELVKPGADRNDLQQAAWAIMDPATLSKANQTVQNILVDAYQHSASFNTAGYQIISDTKDCNQEFMTSSAAPEPASVALMGGSLFLAGIARFFRRKKQAAPMTEIA